MKQKYVWQSFIPSSAASLFRIMPLLLVLLAAWSCSSKVASTAARKKPSPAPYEEVARVARSYLGTPYRYGGMDRKGVDCSGLVCRVYLDAAGVQLPRTADAQARTGQPIRREELRPGDLVFFQEPKAGKITHAGIVSSVDGQRVRFIHAATKRRQVVEDDLDDPHWRVRYVGARRPSLPAKADAHAGPPGKSKP